MHTAPGACLSSVHFKYGPGSYLTYNILPYYKSPEPMPQSSPKYQKNKTKQNKTKTKQNKNKHIKAFSSRVDISHIFFVIK